MTSEASRKTLKKLLLNNECEFVSLGQNCDVAHFLRYSGLRKKAYPFDWCVTPSDSIIKLIENEFVEFLDINSLTFSAPHKAIYFEDVGGRTVESDKVVVTAYCKKYRMEFPHDFPNSDLDSYYKVADKYKTRINRFLKLIKNRPVVFVAKVELGIDFELWAERLKFVLAKNYPDMQFYVCSLDDFKEVVNSSFKRTVIIYVKRKLQRAHQTIRRIFSS